MIATYVPAQLTPVSRELVTKAFLWAFPSHNLPSVALALAHSALETGRWKHCYNFGIGNAKAGPEYRGQYTSRRCNEVIGGELRWFLPEGECDRLWNLLFTIPTFDIPPGHPQTRFRAFANVYDATDDYMHLLERRFLRAWGVLINDGDAARFVRALKEHDYFTADEGPYLKAVASLQREFLRVIEDEPGVPEEPVDEDLQRLLVLAQPIDLEGTGYDGRATPEDWADKALPDGGERA